MTYGTGTDRRWHAPFCAPSVGREPRVAAGEGGGRWTWLKGSVGLSGP